MDKFRAYVEQKPPTGLAGWVKEKLARKVPDEKAASAEEILAAIDELCQKPHQLRRLREYARWRVQGLGRAAEGQNHEDLLNEALTATLAGERRWNKAAVDFPGHLYGVVRSISSHWAEKSQPDHTQLESESIHISPDGKEYNPIESYPSQEPNPERIAMAKQQVEELERSFIGDEVVLLIMEAWKEEMTGPEIKQDLGISQTEYETAMKRLRRRARPFLARG